jgi:mutator family transposase
MAIEKEIRDKLLPDYEKPEDLLGENGLLRQLTKALRERALEAEMATHLGYQKSDPAAKPEANRRNGKSQKTIKGDFGRSRSQRRAIGKPRSSRGSSPRGKLAWPVWTARSCPCTHAA